MASTSGGTDMAGDRRGDEVGAQNVWDRDGEPLWERSRRPERPPMSDLTPAPVFGVAAMPRALRRAQVLFYAGVALLFFSGATIFLTRTTLLADLVNKLHERDATVSTGRLNDLAPYVLYVVIGVLLLVAVPQWGFTALLSTRRHWPRIVLVFVTLLHLVVAGAAVLVIPLDTWAGWLVGATLVIGALLSLIALFRAFSPSVTRWIRARREEEADAAV